MIYRDNFGKLGLRGPQSALERTVTRMKTFLLTAALVTQLFAATLFAQLPPLDTMKRDDSRVFYNAIWPASENVAMGWTGSSSTGNAGTTSYSYKQAVMLRVNFYRAFAGIPAGVTNNPDWSTLDQDAALMMSANKAVSHNPPSSWRFYSDSGATGAGKSNLALSNAGPAAIASYMEDPGSVNAPVGHRRWILFPQTQQMGTGDVPASGGNYAANALWTLDTNHYADARPPVRDQFVAWPPRGYVPYQLVYPRWSFSYPAADFSNASVSVTRNGVALSVRIESRFQGYGENTLVFVPGNVNPDSWTGPVRPSGDVYYDVNVNNVSLNGAAQNFSYRVIQFDPARSGTDSPSATIWGPATPKTGTANSYSLASQTLATGYQWKYSTMAAYTKVVGAETTSDTVARGATRDKRIRAVGQYSFHLTHPSFTETSFLLKLPVLCSASTKLNFASRLTYSTAFETAMVEVSLDGGNQWTSVWSQSGRNSAGEASFAKRSVSLGAYAGREVAVRFRYALRQGSAYTQRADGVGWYVDNISFSNGQRLVSTQVSSVNPSPEFTLTPMENVSYALQVRPQVLGNYFGDWSAARLVTGAR